MNHINDNAGNMSGIVKFNIIAAAVWLIFIAAMFFAGYNELLHFHTIVEFFIEMILCTLLAAGFRSYKFKMAKANAELNLKVEELRSANEFLNIIINSMAHPFYVIETRDHSIKFANKMAGVEIGKTSKCLNEAGSYNGPCRMQTDAAHYCPMNEVVKNKKPVVIEHERVDENGNSKTFEIHGYPVFDQNGEVAQMIEYSFDITARKNAEKAKFESETRYRILFENMTDGFAYHRIINGPGGLPADFVIIEINHEFEKIFNIKRDGCVGKNFLSLIKELNGSLTDLTADLFNIVVAGEDTNFEYYSDDLKTWYRISIFQPEPGHVVTMFSDITPQKKVESALNESQRFFRSVFNSLSDGIAIIDEIGMVISANSTWKKMSRENSFFGRKCDIGMNYLQLFDDETMNGSAFALNIFSGIIKIVAEKINEFKIEGETGAGSGRIYFSVSGNRFDGEGPTRIVIVYNDITEQKKAEDSLRKLSAAIEQSPSTIVITDTFGKIEYVNPKFSETTGYTREEAIGENPRVLKSGELPAEKYKQLWESISSGLDWRGEFHNKRKNGDLYWEQASISAVKNSAGEITHFLAIKEDITARKAMEAELEKARVTAENANRAKSEFLANMSHEIRTPMTSIIGMAELLAESGELSEKQLQCVRMISNSSGLLLTVLNDILDFSKIEAGKLEIENIAFDLKSTLNNACEIISVKTSEKKLCLNILIDANIPKYLKGDPVRIQQIVLNLLNNAVKFTNSGSVSLKAFVLRSDEHGANIRFEIGDTGIGLSDEEIAALFKPFSQADTSTTRKYGGTGLGLSISRRLAELMDGEIGVTSKKGTGSTFWIEIKFEKAEAREGDELREAGSKGTERPAADKTGIIRSNKGETEKTSTLILLADDNPANQRIIRMQLSKLGYENVHVVGDGLEAVNATKENIYSMILMDCQMITMDGYEASRTIREMESGRDHRTPIIALTADAMSGTRKRCIAAGMDDYLTKPTSLLNLQAAIEKWNDQIK